MKHLGDITKINGANVPPVNVVIGGSPCQDLSVAGRREGLKGERSGLFMEQIRIIKEMREKSAQSGAVDIKPRYMVWENVPGAFSSNKGQDFKAVLEETIGIVKEDKSDIPVPKNGWHYSGIIMGDGFSLAWRVFDAQFWGVPQRRRRIALVADFGGCTAPEILFERKSVRGYTPPSRTPWEDFAETVKRRFNSADRSGTGQGIAYSLDSISSNSMKSDNPNSGCRKVDIAKTIDTTIPDPSKNQGGIAVVYDVTRRHTGVTECEVNPQAIIVSDQPVGALCARDYKGVGNQYVDENKLVISKKPSVVCSQSTVRRLTPLECERLQGFPDGWTDIGEYIDTNGKKRKTSDSARYKALGNSIALPPWAWVLERISKHCGDNKTMASLFDGIGGFPLIWETLNGKGTCVWASEIEEFPIAVTKYHFKE